MTKELKLVMDFLEAPGARVSNLDYTISPSTITVSGDAGKLKNVDTIVLGEFDLLKLLDEGADGVIVPCVETVEEVKNWFSTPNTTHWEIEALRPQSQVNSAMNSPMILRHNSGYPTNRRCFYRSARQPSAWSILRRLQL